MKNKKNKEAKASKQPTLTCHITGATRKTSQVYLNSVAQKFAPKGTKNLANAVEKFKDNYANRNAIRMLRDGKSVAEIRKALKSTSNEHITAERLEQILAFNGKHGSKKVSVKVKGRKARETVNA